MASKRSRRIRVAFFAMNLLPSLNSRWTQLVLPSPSCAKRSRTWHSIALAHCGSVTLARAPVRSQGSTPCRAQSRSAAPARLMPLATVLSAGSQS